MSNTPTTPATPLAGTEYIAFPKALWPGVKACFARACEKYLPAAMVADDPFGVLMRADFSDTKSAAAVICRTEKIGVDTFVECAPVVRVDIYKLLENPHRDFRMFKKPLQEYAAALEAN